MLEPEEEYMLAKRWVEEEDSGAAHKMVTSHLRLAAKIAMGYRGYGLPQAEVIAEANVGLMQAVKRLTEKGSVCRPMRCDPGLNPGIYPAVLSLVKLGTTSAEETILQPAQGESRIGALEDGDLHPEHVEKIANDLSVTEDEVISMNRRLSGGMHR